jgi:subtilisin family serine protease
MGRRKGLWALGLAAGLVAIAVGAPAAPAVDASAARAYIVVYRDGVSRPGAATAAQSQRLGFDVEYRYSAALDGFAARLSRAQLDAVREDPRIDFVAPDGRAEAAGIVPLAPGESLPPTGLRRIRAATKTTAHEASTSNVAVIDTGIRLAHPDLRAVNGTDCIEPGTAASDVYGHGTHIAGTIGALNNGSGVIGIAPGTKLYSVRVLGDDGFGSFAQIICGIDWVTANHESKNIGVANMSLTGIEFVDPTQPCATTTSPMHKAICNSTAAGVTYVVGAGNDSAYYEDPSYPTVPAAFPQVLTVTAVSDFDGRPGALSTPSCTPYGSDDANATFSNFAATDRGESHTIAAPGDCIESTWNRPPFYSVRSGTSTASPHVAGLVALCIGEVGSAPGPCAGKSPAQVINIVRQQASRFAATHPGFGFSGDPDTPLWPRYYGYLAHLRPPQPPPDG